MSEQAQKTEAKKTFISLRVKLLVGFTLIFAIVFAVAFFWFYTFATAQAMGRIQQDITDTLLAAAQGTDVEQLMALYAEGQPNADGFSDDPRYEAQLNWLQQVHNIEPRAWPYNYVKGDDATPVIYIADLWVRYDPSKAVQFLEPKTSKGQSYQGFSGLKYREGYAWTETVEKWCTGWFGGVFTGWCDDTDTFPLAQITQEGFNTYTDQWGRWVSAYAPVYDSTGNAVAAVGVDFEADYIDQVQSGIREKVVLAFLVTYGSLFVLIYLFSGALTQPIRSLTSTAELIGEGDYEQDFEQLTNDRFPDEIDTLAQVFQIMVGKVYQREQSLKRKVEELQIIVDERKKKEQVEEIADSDFFRDLQQRAKDIRGRNNPTTAKKE